MKPTANVGAETPLASTAGGLSLGGDADIDPAALSYSTPEDHDPEAKALLRRYLAEIHSFREMGNQALRNLEARLAGMPVDESDDGFDEPEIPVSACPAGIGAGLAVPPLRGGKERASCRSKPQTAAERTVRLSSCGSEPRCCRARRGTDPGGNAGARQDPRTRPGRNSCFSQHRACRFSQNRPRRRSPGRTSRPSRRLSLSLSPPGSGAASPRFRPRSSTRSARPCSRSRHSRSSLSTRRRMRRCWIVPGSRSVSPRCAHPSTASRRTCRSSASSSSRRSSVL